MGLSGIGEIRTPVAQPWYIHGGGYCGVVHDDEITPAIKAVWELEARMNVYEGCDFMCVDEKEDAQDSLLESAPYGVEKPGELVFARHSTPGRSLKMLQRVPASPGWFNVYLTNREPWFLIRAIAVWMLVRERRQNVSAISALLSFVSRYEAPSIIGVDGRLDFPAVGGSPGFLEMTHKSMITPAATERWVSLAKKATGPT